MIEISNYGGLKETTAKFLNRRDVNTLENIPLFINFAEKEFTRHVRLPYYETLASSTIAKGFEFIGIPADFVALKHLVINGVVANRVDLEKFTTLTSSDDGLYFARVGAMLRTHPELKEGDTFMMVYHRDIPEMKNDVDAPYSLIVAPDVLLYLTLRHAAIYLRDNEQEAYWAAKATEAAQGVMKLVKEAEWSGSTLRIK